MVWEMFKGTGWLIIYGGYGGEKKRKNSDDASCFLLGW